LTRIGYQVAYSENHERGGVINSGINSKMRRNSLAAVGRVRIIVSTVFARTGSKRGMTLARPFQPEVTEADRVLRISWDNRRCPRDNGHLVTLILLQSLVIPVAVFSACLGLANGTWHGLSFAIMFGSVWWLVAICMGYDMLGRRWCEWVEVSSTTITVGWRGFLATGPKVVPIGPPGVELFLGRYEDSDTRSARPSLDVVWRVQSWGSQRRVEFGRWLPMSAKEQIFQTLAAFISANQIPVTAVRDLA